MRFLLTLWIAKLVAVVVNILDKSRGSNYSGKIALRLQNDFVAQFKNIDYSKVYFISGTNGKSTTTNLLYHTIRSAGRRVASNTEGANMMGGIATTLIKNSSLLGRFNKEYLVLEIDERSFPLIRKVLPGRCLGITNLQKDQVQRNGDPDFILRKIRGALSEDMTLYLNAEEPRSQSLADHAGTARYFSVAKNERSFIDDSSVSVTLPCPKCAHPIRYAYYNLASIGKFSCTKCGYRSPESADVRVDSIDPAANTFVCCSKTWRVGYSNPYYIYNFAMCIAICRDIGMTDDEIQNGFSTFNNPASHKDVFHACGKEIHYLRGKQENPEALQSQIDIIAADKREKAVFVGMYPVADFTPHYGCSFYLFDCDFESVVKSGVERFVAFSPVVANDIAARFVLAGAPESTVTVCDTDDLGKVFSLLPEIRSDVIYVLTNPKHAPAVKQYFAKEKN